MDTILRKKYFSKYITELERFFERKVELSELLELEDTLELSKITFDNDLKFKSEFNSEAKFYSAIRNWMDDLNGYVFIKNSSYCGAFRTSLTEFISNSPNVRLIEDEIVVFISEKLDLKILIEFYDNVFELEIYNR